MSRHLITIHGPSDREQAARWAMHAKAGMRIEFKEAKRSGEQNDKLWAMLTEVATQVPWHGIKLHADDWKFIFLDALKRELRVVPNIDGTGFVNLGRSSSDLSKSEMSDLIELIHEFGARQNVAFKEDSNSSDAARQTDTPAAESVPPPAAAGNLSESSDPSPADGDVQAGVSSQGTGLPSGWEIRLRDALFKAQQASSLVSCARQCFEKLGAFPTEQRDVDAAKAIRAVFEKNFGNETAINDGLRDLI